MGDRIRIVEVGPRDGLQSERSALPVRVRAELVDRLIAAGVREVEVGSFVSARRVPQMAGTDAVMASLTRRADARCLALVPNLAGLEAAIAAGFDAVAVFASASETFSRQNINCSVAESLDRIRPVLDRARGSLAVRGYVSCAFGCPYEGAVPVAAVVDLARRLVEFGCHEAAISDTIGVATPPDAVAVASAVAREIGTGRTALHFHDTHGHALANIRASLDVGIRCFDGSVAGLGGCPFAPGATGNVATEDAVLMLHELGLETGIDLSALREAGAFISGHLGRPPPTGHARAAHGPAWQ